MFEMIYKKDLPKDLVPLKLEDGSLNKEARIFVCGNELFKLYRDVKSIRYANDFQELKENHIPYALCPNYYIMNQYNQIEGEVQDYIVGRTLSEGIESYKNVRDIDKRLVKMQQLIDFVKGLDSHNYFHNDLHCQNFLEDENRIYAIDLGGVYKTKAKKTDIHQMRTKIILLSYLFGISEKEAKNLLEYKVDLYQCFSFAPQFLKYLLGEYDDTVYADTFFGELAHHEEEATKVHRLCAK